LVSCYTHNLGILIKLNKHTSRTHIHVNLQRKGPSHMFCLVVCFIFLQFQKMSVHLLSTSFIFILDCMRFLRMLHFFMTLKITPPSCFIIPLKQQNTAAIYSLLYPSPSLNWLSFENSFFFSSTSSEVLKLLY